MLINVACDVARIACESELASFAPLEHHSVFFLANLFGSEDFLRRHADILRQARSNAVACFADRLNAVSGTHAPTLML